MCGVRAGKRVCSGERSSRMKWRTLRFIPTTVDRQEEELCEASQIVIADEIDNSAVAAAPS